MDLPKPCFSDLDWSLPAKDSNKSGSRDKAASGRSDAGEPALRSESQETESSHSLVNGVVDSETAPHGDDAARQPESGNGVGNGGAHSSMLLDSPRETRQPYLATASTKSYSASPAANTSTSNPFPPYTSSESLTIEEDPSLLLRDEPYIMELLQKGPLSDILHSPITPSHSSFTHSLQSHTISQSSLPSSSSISSTSTYVLESSANSSDSNNQFMSEVKKMEEQLENNLLGLPQQNSALEATVGAKRSTPASSSSATGQRSNKRQKTDKREMKGLKRISQLVVETIQKMPDSTYQEVADRVVEIMKEEKEKPEKNAGRRVYDALNVLKALKVIDNHKKRIKWIGFPSQTTVEEQQQRIHQKRESYMFYKNELDRTQQLCQSYRELDARYSQLDPPLTEDKRIPVPFILISVNADSDVFCEMDPKRTHFLFEFSNQFQLYEDTRIQELIEQHQEDQLQQQQMLASLHPHLPH